MKATLQTTALVALLSIASILTATVKEVTALQELNTILNNNSQILIVVDFYSPQCGWCKQIAPEFEKLSKSDDSTIYLKVNSDTFAPPFDISALPTFKIYVGTKEVDQVLGADIKKLKHVIASQKRQLKHNKKRNKATYN